MANHVTNRLKIVCSKKEVKEVLDFIKGKNGVIDFNEIIPMPDNIYRGDLGRKERKLYGENNWYDWSVSNWGTKWNAYNSSFDDRDNTLYFDTAWSTVPEVISELSSQFPDVRFELSYADEDVGYNTGIIHFEEGYMIHVDVMDEGSKRAFENAVDVLGIVLDYEEYVS